MLTRGQRAQSLRQVCGWPRGVGATPGPHLGPGGCGVEAVGRAAAAAGGARPFWGENGAVGNFCGTVVFSRVWLKAPVSQAGRVSSSLSSSILFQL